MRSKTCHIPIVDETSRLTAQVLLCRNRGSSGLEVCENGGITHRRANVAE